MTVPAHQQARVLELLLSGVDRPDIAAALGLSPHTVAHAIEALMHAHGAPTVTVLVARVLGERLAAAQDALAGCRAALQAVDQRRADRRAG